MEIDSIKQYLMDISSKPSLSPEEELELIKKAKSGDENAYKYFLECNLKRVITIAKLYMYRGLEFLDLIQEGCIGLIEAYEHYEVKDRRFSDYAYWWIRRAINNALADKSRNIRLPHNVYNKILELLKVKRSLLFFLGRIPTLLEISKVMNLSVEEIEELFNYIEEPLSLSSLIDLEREDTRGDVWKNSYDEYVCSSVDNPRKNLSELIDSLSIDEVKKQILRYHFKIGELQYLSIEEICEFLGITPNMFGRLRSNALNELLSENFCSFFGDFEEENTYEGMYVLPSYELDFSENRNPILDLINNPSLSEIEKEILICNIGLLGSKSSLKEIGSKWGLSKQRMSQLKKSALEKIKQSVGIYPHSSSVGTSEWVLNNGDIITEGISDSSSDVMLKSIKSNYFVEFIVSLPPREEQIMALRYGYVNGKKYNISTISKKTGLKTEEVVNILTECLNSFKQVCEEKFLEKEEQKIY